MLLCTVAIFIAGCTVVMDTSRYNFEQRVYSRTVPGLGFEHLTVFKPGEGSVLHVYIEGDGRPWETRVARADDPTPAWSIMLDLMTLDTRPALFLGRPCYFIPGEEACDNDRWWTSHRYAAQVVDSMSAALDRSLDSDETDYDSIVLIGHSGGGTLAYLLARQRTDVSALVTLAANLNVGMWTRHHRYAPLYGSLDPAWLEPLPQAIRQLHLMGRLDRNVLPSMVRSVVGGQSNAQVETIEAVDHVCCWKKHWTEQLGKLEAANGG